MLDVGRLVVMRHAEAAWEGSGGDRMRPLTPRGRQQARAVGVSLAAAGWKPRCVLCSQAVRTLQTWEMLAPALPTPEQVVTSWDLYHGGAAAYLGALALGGGEAATVMLVGHNPVVSELVELLTNQRVRFGTADVALLRAEIEGRWRGWEVAVGVPVRFTLERVIAG